MPDKKILIDHFFRAESGKVISLLTSKFGPMYLGLIEDCVQEAFIKAMKTWPYKGTPENPSAWINRVSKNLVLDHIRRSQKVFYATQLPEQTENDKEVSEEVFKDSIIKMMFACCNPSLSTDQQLILTLKILGGLSVKEISNALLKKEESVAKTYTRAKQKFKEENLSLDLPNEKEISRRFQIVLRIIYLIFNEGYKSSGSDEIIRQDLCDEAMRMNFILLDYKLTNTTSSKSLMALMHYNVARFTTRIDDQGIPISLKDQDRSKWDQKQIDLGNRYLNNLENALSDFYFLQASITGFHSIAKSYLETNWKAIERLYDELLKLQQNPVIKLNRLICILNSRGVSDALTEIKQFKIDHPDFSNYLLNAVMAEIHLENEDKKMAIQELSIAIQKLDNKQEIKFFEKKIEILSGNI